MPSLQLDNYSIIFQDFNGVRHILFDGEHPINNFSRLPMQDFNAAKCISERLIEINELHSNISVGTREHDLIPFISDSIIANKLTSYDHPIKVLEIGTDSGIYSWHLLNLLGQFNPNNQLCYVTDILGEQALSSWIDTALQQENPCKFSYLISDYDNIPIIDNYFDIVVIDSSTIESNPLLIEIAYQKANLDGIVIVHSRGDITLIESNIHDYYSFISYPLTASSGLLVINKNDISINELLAFRGEITLSLDAIKSHYIVDDTCSPFNDIEGDILTLKSLLEKCNIYNLFDLKQQIIDEKEFLEDLLNE